MSIHYSNVDEKEILLMSACDEIFYLLFKQVLFKNNINLWYQEMDRAGSTKEEMKVLEPYFLKSYGVPPSQEQMMQMLME